MPLRLALERSLRCRMCTEGFPRRDFSRRAGIRRPCRPRTTRRSQLTILLFSCGSINTLAAFFIRFIISCLIVRHHPGDCLKPLAFAKSDQLHPLGVTATLANFGHPDADQLYLALRLAAIDLHLENHPAIPLILDDLLMTFDDERTRALLPVLKELSQKTQILIFTHHVHLKELAGPEVVVHELRGA